MESHAIPRTRMQMRQMEMMPIVQLSDKFEMQQMWHGYCLGLLIKSHSIGMHLH